MRRRKIRIGYAFSEHIYAEKKFFFQDKGARYKEHIIKMRSYLLPLTLGIISLLLLGRLFFLQVFQGYYYRTVADSNRFRSVLIHAPRGIITDRNGLPLVLNTPGYRETINGKTFFLSQAEALNALAKGDKNLEVDSLRKYTGGEVYGHIVGYIGEISADQLREPSYRNYRAGDIIGQMGIEKSYNDNLKGTDGRQMVEVDALGKITKVIGQTDPIPGENITLTIDNTLQQQTFDAMHNVKKGTAIVSTPQGEILAVVSKPSFDPNLFTMGKTYTPAPGDTYQTISDVLTDTQNQPLLNRAISGTYPPGSTFKIVVAAAALQDQVINSNFTVNDKGVVKLGDFSFANWYYTQYGKTDGIVDTLKAIQRSNDIFFYTLGAKLGVDRLSDFAKEFGLGTKLGIDLPGEARGLVPTKEWKKRVIGEDWFTGDDYHYGIGQGYLLTTPLQVNIWTQAIANKGVLYQPHIAKVDKKKVRDHILSENNYSLIRDGMIRACSNGGVAYPLFNFTVENSSLPIDGQNFTQVASKSADFRHIAIACKTGTAQHGNTESLPHAWITLFAPAYNPQIIVTVLSEDSGEGSDIAGPIAKDILTAWFSKKR